MAKTKKVIQENNTNNQLKINQGENVEVRKFKWDAKDSLEALKIGRHRKDFYQELNNGPFVVGIYSSEFNDFFDKEKLGSLGFVDNPGLPGTFNQSSIETDYIHQYITSLNFSSSINAPYMTLDFTAKMPAEIFHYYFQNSLTKSPTTGQWIALYTRNESSKDIAIKSTLSQLDILDNEHLKQNVDLIPTGKEEFNNLFKSNVNGDNVTKKTDNVMSTNPTRVDLAKEILKKSQEAQNNKNIENLISDYQILVDEAEAIANNQYQPHHCMFFGIVDDLSYKMSASPTGVAMFDITVRCVSFISHLEKNQYLVAVPKIEENINGAVYNKSLSEYAKNKNFKPAQAFIKDVQYWTSMVNEFTYAGASQYQNLAYEIKKILISLTRNYLPLDMHSVTCKKSFLDPISKEKINENGLLTLGSIINVAAEQQHLPSQSTYRQMLPLTARHMSTIDRFKTTLSGKGTVWNLINGTFVVDANLIECFPVMIPFNNRKELNDILQNYANNSFVNSDENEFTNDAISQPHFKPFLYDEAICKFYEQLGAIPTLIYRLKPLQPNGQISKDNINLINEIADIGQYERIEDATYSEKLIFNKNKKVEVAQNKSKTELDKFGFEDALNFNKDAPFSQLLPSLNFDELLSFEAKQNENDRINGLYIESPIIRNKSNFTIGSFADPILDIKDAVAQGFRFYDSDYPFFDVYTGAKPKEMSAMIERYYAIYGGGQNRSKGIIQLKMNYNPEFLTGSWIRIRMNNDQQIIDSQQIKIKGNEEYEEANKEAEFKKSQSFAFDDTSDFFCYIDNISYNYLEGPGLSCICTIQFSRGSFGLNYAHFPNVRLANHLESTKTFNEAKIDEYLDKQKSKPTQTVPSQKTDTKNDDIENLKKSIKNDDLSQQNQKIKTNVPSVNDFVINLPTNPQIKKQSTNQIKEGLKDIIQPQSIEEKRFEQNEVELDLKNTPQTTEIPIIMKHNMNPVIAFGPYKAGTDGPFPTWPDANGDFILDETEFKLIYPDPYTNFDAILKLNQDAASRGFKQLNADEVYEWQTANGLLPDPLRGE